MASQRRTGAGTLLQPERRTEKIDFSKTYSTSSLKGQSVVVTGGATGIGQGSAIAFAEAGALVTIADLNEKDAKKTVDELSAQGHKIQFIKTDVTSWSDLVAAFKSAIAFGGGLDIVLAAAGISNAGAGNGRWLDEGGKDENGDPLPVPTKVLAVNGDAVFNTAHLAMYYFRENPAPVERSKQIIFVASMAGYSSMTGVMDYATSKVSLFF
jgi:5'-hydroxyaverantin dehydrogenase